ncbi:phenylacetate--CoA ligase family protein [candidate division KSB1 bacterium]
MTIWDAAAETMDRVELEKLQLRRLHEVLNRVSDHPFYSDHFRQNDVRLEDVRSLSDLAGLPFTVKDDLRHRYPYGMFAVPMGDIVRVHSSSGTTGKPTVVGYTAADLEIWSGLMARIMTAAGVTQEDIVQIAFGYGMFTGGFGLHYGAERIGAAVLPVSSGNTARQINIMKDFGATALVCTPSYALHLAEAAVDLVVDPRELPLRLGLFGAEPWSEAMRAEIEDRLGINASNNYGLSEIIGPGVSGECPAREGLHINEDHFLPEIIDPDSGDTLPYGSEGELVLTTLTKEAFPMIRYRTGDITAIDPAPCSCGRSLARMSWIKGRTDDMLVIRGVNVFPSQIESVLLEIDRAEPHYQLVVSRDEHLDTLTVRVEVDGDDPWSLEKKITSKIREVLGLSARVEVLPPKSLERSSGKAERVVDNRPPI